MGTLPSPEGEGAGRVFRQPLTFALARRAVTPPLCLLGLYDIFPFLSSREAEDVS